MTSIEDQLRGILAARADMARAMDDPAGRAIRRGRALRRRRALGSGLAAAMVVVLGLSGAVWVHARLLPSADNGGAGGPLVLPLDPPASPAGSAEPAVALVAPEASTSEGDAVRAIGLDLLVGRQLWTVAGRRYALTGVGKVLQAFRVPLGWVYGGAEQVRLLRLDGSSVTLGAFGPRWLVSPDGARLAYGQSRRLSVHRLGKRGLGGGVTVTVPTRVRPVAFAGGQVVVVSGENGDFGSFAPDQPEQPYRPVPTKGLVSVYGPAGDEVAGLVWEDGRAEVCLAALQAGRRGLVEVRRGSCRSAPIAGAAKAVLGPDGGWLAEPGPDGTALVEVNRALRGIERTVACPVVSKAAPVWLDGTTLVVAAERRVVRCRTDGSTEYVALPEDLPAGWAFVPRLVPADAR
jgi:hypothetical protein